MEKRFFILAGICLLAHAVRTAYEILKHRKTIKAGKTSFIIIFADMILLWASWFLLCGADTRLLIIPSIVRYAGLAGTAAGFILFLTGLFTIKTLETYEGGLMTTGIYSRIRHPMYLGFILWLIGYPVYCGAYFSMILAVLLVINVLYWRHLEELELLQRFADYSEYRRRTWF